MSVGTVRPSWTALSTNTQALPSQQPGGLLRLLPPESPRPFSINPLELSVHRQTLDVNHTVFPTTEMAPPCQRVLASTPQVNKENATAQSAPKPPKDLPTAYPVLVKLEYVKQMYHLKLGMDNLNTGLRAWAALFKRFNPHVDQKALTYDWDLRFKEYILNPLYATALPFLELMYLRSSPTTPNIPFILPTLLNKDLCLVNWSPMPLLMSTAHIIFAMLSKNTFSGVIYHLMGHGPLEDLDAQQTLQARARVLSVYHKVVREIFTSMAMVFNQSLESKRADLQSLIHIWSHGFELRERELKAKAMESPTWQNARFPDGKEELLSEMREKERKERAEVRKYFRYWCQDVGVTLRMDNQDSVAQTHPGNGPVPQAPLQTVIQQQAQTQAQHRPQHQAQQQAQQQTLQRAHQQAYPHTQQHAQMQTLLQAYARHRQQARMQAQQPNQQQAQQQPEQQPQQQPQQDNNQSGTNMADTPPTNGPSVPPLALAASQATSQRSSQGANSTYTSSYQPQVPQPYQALPAAPGDQHFIQLPEGHRTTPDIQPAPPPLPPYSRPCITRAEEEKVTSFLRTWGRDGNLWNQGHGPRPREPVPPLGEVWIDGFMKPNLRGFRWL